MRKRLPQSERKTSHGYIHVYVNNVRTFEHRAVMAVILGRPMAKGENVHHRNGIRSDNRPANLELWTRRQPPGVRVSDLVAFAREVLAQYGNGAA
jgi:hypothetical protein